eukprot:2287515-Rhodomonas_salina.2
MVVPVAVRIPVEVPSTPGTQGTPSNKVSSGCPGYMYRDPGIPMHLPVCAYPGTRAPGYPGTSLSRG